MTGFIKLHRQILKWEWYDDANTMRLFIHCLLSANHDTQKWHGREIKAGQFITGRLKLAQALKLSEQQIRTSLERLKSTSEITSETTSRYSIITINNWELYQQNNQQNNQQITNKQPTDNQQITTNKNDKNDKNDKNNILYMGNKKIFFKKPSLEEVKKYCIERKNLVDAEKFISYYDSNGWMVGKNKMKDWQAAVRTWEKNENKTGYNSASVPKKENGWEL